MLDILATPAKRATIFEFEDMLIKVLFSEREQNFFGLLMGRKAIPIEAITNERNRQVGTFD